MSEWKEPAMKQSRIGFLSACVLLGIGFTLVAGNLSADADDYDFVAHIASVHRELQDMDRDMRSIAETADPEQRRRLLFEHMQSMHRAMQALEIEMRALLYEKELSGDSDDAAVAAEKSEGEHDARVQQLMELMQRMLQQMSAHLEAARES
jgi:hypothetical protein